MDEFTTSENKGRWLFKQVLEKSNIDRYKFSEDKYSCWDCKYWSENREYTVEIKVRNCNHLQYLDWILELSKYNCLLASGGKALYVNFFKDGYCAIWSLEDVDISSVENRDCKATTVEDNGYRNKEVLFLKIEDAVRFGKLNLETNEKTDA